MSDSLPIVTWTLIAVSCVVSWLAFKNPKLAERLIFWPPAISQGRQYDRFVTHGFIHADIFHLIFNMFTLFFFGQLIERIFEPRIGKPGFALFYLAAIVIAILPSWWRLRQDANYLSLGASGGVAAVRFSFVLFAPWATIYVFVIPMPAILFAVMYTAYSIWAERRASDNINHSAHLAGAAFGVLATLVIEPRALGSFLRQLSQPWGN